MQICTTSTNSRSWRAIWGGRLLGAATPVAARLGLVAALGAVATALLLFATANPVGAQSTNDYDSDNDGLIEVTNLAKLNAIRWDLNGNGNVAAGDLVNYRAAFPSPVAKMGCKPTDHDGDPTTADQPVCIGYELTNDLTFDENMDNAIDSGDATYWDSGAGWEPLVSLDTDGTVLGAYTATFDGNSNIIDYLFINRNALNYVGLFGQLDNPGRIRNLTLTHVNVTGEDYVGALVGFNMDGVVGSVTASGDLTGNDYLGGLVGHNGCITFCNGLVGTARVEGSSFTGSVTGVKLTVESYESYGHGSQHIGGLVGHNAHHIANSYADATVKGSSGVGGLVGVNNTPGLVMRALAASTAVLTSITSSYALGDVTAEYIVAGGLAGQSVSTTISESYATGDVSGAGRVGGLVGYHEDAKTSDSYATGAVVSQGSGGGLVGGSIGSSEITNSYATGAVTSPYAGGGLVGLNEDDSLIATSYATGSVVANLAGGLVGDNYSIIRDSYAYGPVTGTLYAGGLVGCNLEEGSILRSYASGEVSLASGVEDDPQAGGLVGMNSADATATDSYWDTTVSRQTSSPVGTGHTTAELQAPTGYTGIYAVWNVDLSVITGDSGDTGKADLWDFGTAIQYPALKVDFDNDNSATVAEFGSQRVNRAPVFTDGPTTQRMVRENTASGAGIGLPVSATDPYGGNVLAYSLDRTGDQAHFSIDTGSGQLLTSGTLDYESDNIYTVTIIVTDGSLTDSIVVTINIADLPESSSAQAVAQGVARPQGPAGPQPGTLDLPVRRLAGRSVAAPDASMLVSWAADESADEATYYRIRRRVDTDGSQYQVIVRKLNDNGELDADDTSGQLAYRDSGNNLLPGQNYLYGVRSFFGDGSRSRWTTTAGGDGAETPAAPVNQAPAFADSSVSLSVAENTAAGTNIGNANTATDPDTGDTLAYTLGSTADDGHFAINSGTGQLKTQGALDYESKTTYAVRVTATDGDGLSASIAVTITVTNVADTPPARPDAPTISNVAETYFRMTWTAPAAGSSAIAGYGIQYKLASEDDSAYADAKPTKVGTFTGYNLVNRSGQSITAGTSYSVRVRAKNTEGWSEWSNPAIAATVAPAPVNTAPAFAASSISLSVAENTAASTAIGKAFAATDSNAGDTLAYALGSTDDDGHFAIDSSSGQLKTKGALDYESKTSYAVTVTATDGGELTASVTVTITVTNVNEAPAFAASSVSLSVAENTAVGTAIGDAITATELDAGDSLTYTLGSAADDGHFAIDSSSSQVKTKGALDYESKDSYSVTVTATDGGGLTASVSVTITVTNVNEAPAFAASSVSLSVAENTAVGTAIGDAITAADLDAGDSLTYTLGSAADDGHFAIDSSSSQVKTKGALDYESKDFYSVTVTATDGGGLTASVSVTITVSNVADTPPGQPDTPEIINVKETSFRITWTAPAAGSSAIAGYGIQYKLASEEDSAYADVKPTKAGIRTGYNLVNRNGQSITAGTSYDVQVRARNAEGWGPWSAPATAVTGGTAPPPDTTETAEEGEQETADNSYQAEAIYVQGRIVLTWDDVDGAESYRIQKNGRLMPGRFGGTRYYDDNVVRNSRYEYQITAYDGNNSVVAVMTAETGT